jgi:hypothetical protein
LKGSPSLTERIRSNSIFLCFVFQCLFLLSTDAIADNSLSEAPNENATRVVSSEPGDDLTGIINPLKSTCYDWRGAIVPCDYKRPYAELLTDKPIPEPRFRDNKNGTVTDNLTGLIWLKNTKCFGDRIIFIDTGGIFGLFPKAREIEPLLA